MKVKMIALGLCCLFALPLLALGQDTMMKQDTMKKHEMKVDKNSGKPHVRRKHRKIRHRRHHRRIRRHSKTTM